MFGDKVVILLGPGAGQKITDEGGDVANDDVLVQVAVGIGEIDAFGMNVCHRVQRNEQE